MRAKPCGKNRGKQYFEVVNPGKAEVGGGYENRIKALGHAVEVFGKGRARSNFVVGLQPKKVLFEGLEYLTSIGACFTCGIFAQAPLAPFMQKFPDIGLLTQFVRYKYSFYEYLYHFIHEVQQTASLLAACRTFR
jgi:hypothetical protein